MFIFYFLFISPEFLLSNFPALLSVKTGSTIGSDKFQAVNGYPLYTVAPDLSLEGGTGYSKGLCSSGVVAEQFIKGIAYMVLL